MDSVEVRPEQPPAVEQAIAAVLEPGAPALDPWWSEGNREALDT